MLKLLSLLFALWYFLGITEAKGVLIILGDDVGFESGVYGNNVCKTPNIDGLAQRSLVFDNAYTSVSSCSPSRSALLTGLPQHQNGMYGLQNGYHHYQSFDGILSLSNILRNNSVYTGIIGKKNVAPQSVYTFDYSRTELDHISINQVGRNITRIKLLVSEFLRNIKGRDFFLYVAFHDAHRCGHTNPELGEFCENFGDPSLPGMGRIPDWTPVYYDPTKVDVPYFVPVTPAAKADIAAQYKTISRFDQGVGLVMKEFENAGLLNDTLIIFSSDNGIPFPNGRTNLYESGIREPFMISHPIKETSWNKRSDALVSLLDVMPTVLDWFSVAYPRYYIPEFRSQIYLTGKSLLPLIEGNPVEGQGLSTELFASQSVHEVTMYYPMRAIITEKYKLIINMASRLPFPIDQDFYVSPTFLDMLNRTTHGERIPWFKTLEEYYFRDPYELYDLTSDPYETVNLYKDKAFRDILLLLYNKLNTWQNITSDPWLCYPWGVLQDSGTYSKSPQCMPLYNSL